MEFENDTNGEEISINRTECIPVNDLYDVELEFILLLSFLYGTIAILSVVGNSLVIWIISTSKRMQNVTNIFIANLALADILIGLFTTPFEFQAALLQRWNLPYFMCAFCPFVQVLSVNVSVFTLTAIAIDRHRAILMPLRPKPSKLMAKFIISGIWIVSILLATPIGYALRVKQRKFRNQLGTTVIEHPFCSVANLSDSQMQAYKNTLAIVQYLIPLSVITFAYVQMAVCLWGSRAPGNAQDSRDATILKKKKKVIKMLVIVVAVFGLCWFPLQFYNVLQHICPLIDEYRYINIIWFCCDWLAMSNSCYNPFIYGIYNEKFKREFQHRFKLRAQIWNAKKHRTNSMITSGKSRPFYRQSMSSMRENHTEMKSFVTTVTTASVNRDPIEPVYEKLTQKSTELVTMIPH